MAIEDEAYDRGVKDGRREVIRLVAKMVEAVRDQPRTFVQTQTVSMLETVELVLRREFT